VAREEQTLRVKYGQWRCAAISAEKGRRTRWAIAGADNQAYAPTAIPHGGAAWVPAQDWIQVEV
jgi:hypothetical protein